MLPSYGNIEVKIDLKFDDFELVLGNYGWPLEMTELRYSYAFYYRKNYIKLTEATKKIDIGKPRWQNSKCDNFSIGKDHQVVRAKITIDLRGEIRKGTQQVKRN